MCPIFIVAFCFLQAFCSEQQILLNCYAVRNEDTHIKQKVPYSDSLRLFIQIQRFNENNKEMGHNILNQPGLDVEIFNSIAPFQLKGQWHVQPSNFKGIQQCCTKLIILHKIAEIKVALEHHLFTLWP